jgi:mannose-1-phosphate guanylyltransferase
MDAIVLVGGFGTRLLPLTKVVPKPLIPLANVPFVERLVHWLRGAGVSHVILSLHYNAEQFIDHLSSRALGVDFSFAVEASPLGTGGAIKHCEPCLRSSRCFVINGDIFTDLSLSAMLAAHEETRAAVSIALKEVEDPCRYGVIETDADGHIRSFTEKPPRALARSRDINAGVYLFERGVFDAFPEGPCSVERDIFPRLLDDGRHLHGYHEYPYWTDLGTPADYLQAHRDILRRRVRVPLTATETRPGIWTGQGTQVADDVLLRPPVLMGDGVHIAAGATVGPSVVLGPGARVDADALVEDTVVWDNAAVRAGSRVRGSIVGRGATVGGTVTGQVCAHDEVATCANETTNTASASE